MQFQYLFICVFVSSYLATKKTLSYQDFLIQKDRIRAEDALNGKGLSNTLTRFQNNQTVADIT